MCTCSNTYTVWHTFVTSVRGFEVGEGAWLSPFLTTQRRFELAMDLVGGEFTERVREYKDIWLPARTIVLKALDSRLQVSNT